MVAPQAFKGSMTAMEAARAMAEGVRRALAHAEVALAPVADGGDGTVEALVDATGGTYRTSRVTGPLGEPVQARWGLLGDGETAVIEMARAAGLVLVPPERRDPRVTTTRGVGELVREALEEGRRRIVVGLGGSATNDGGAGMAQALGVRFLDEGGEELPPGGIHLRRLARIDLTGLHPAARRATVLVASDVNNPLCGPRGAAAVYGPQKGATAEMVQELDAALARFAQVVRRDVGVEVAEVPGAGAAGGLGAGGRGGGGGGGVGAGLMAFLGAELRPGFDLVAEVVGFRQRLKGAHLVLTGEGQVDGSTVYNKAPVGVARSAAEEGIPTVCFAGSLGEGYEAVYEAGIAAVVPLVPRPMALEEAMAQGPALLAAAVERALRLLPVGRRVL